MIETTKYLVAHPNHAHHDIYDATNISKEDDGALVIERVNEYGTSYVRVLKSPNNKVYELREIA